MKRAFIYVVVMLLLLPAAGHAQGQSEDRSPIPDHWLTLDSLATALGLTLAEKDGIAEAYAAVNEALQNATQKRNVHKESFRGLKNPKHMTDDERTELMTRLQVIRAEYDGRQAELEERLAALRALLTSDQQVLFDALPKPRLVPAPRPPRN